MVACDFQNHFVYVMSGWEGSASDAAVLKSAIDEGGFYVPQDKFYLVDGGYANTPNFIAPYHGQKYHLREHGGVNQRPRNYKELFNLRHARLRNHVERIIGVLKMRFLILKVGTYYPLDIQRDIATAACILHNFIVYHNGDMTWPFKYPSSIPPSEFTTMPERDEEVYNGDVQSLNIQREAGNRKRDEIAMTMWENYTNRRRSINP
jgi:DDE superfamily endonuclease